MWVWHKVHANYLKKFNLVRKIVFPWGPGRETENIAALLVTHMAKDVGLTPVSPCPQSSSARPYLCNEGPIPETWKYQEDFKSGIGLQKMTRVEQMVISCSSDNGMALNAAQGARCVK